MQRSVVLIAALSVACSHDSAPAGGWVPDDAAIAPDTSGPPPPLHPDTVAEFVRYAVFATKDEFPLIDAEAANARSRTAERMALVDALYVELDKYWRLDDDKYSINAASYIFPILEILSSLAAPEAAAGAEVHVFRTLPPEDGTTRSTLEAYEIVALNVLKCAGADAATLQSIADTHSSTRVRAFVSVAPQCQYDIHY